MTVRKRYYRLEKYGRGQKWLSEERQNMKKQAKAIEAALDGMNQLNAGKYNCVGVIELPDTNETDSKTA